MAKRCQVGIALALAAACAQLACAQAGAQPGAPARAVPVRDLGPVVARTTSPIGFFFGLQQFSGGRVLINDAKARTLTFYDSTLSSGTIIADTIGGPRINYGRAITPLLPFAADSALFIDFASSSMLLIGPAGTIVRVLAPPKSQDLGLLRQSVVGADPEGRLLYRGNLPRRPRVLGAPPPPPIDSAPIVRADFESRTVDTVALIKIPDQLGFERVERADGKLAARMLASPFVWVDDWALYSDGSIAILRGRDYHIDWIASDGTRSSSPRMPFDWRHITDQDKRRLLDSLRSDWETKSQLARSLTLQEAASLGITADKAFTVTLPDGSKVVPLDIGLVPLAEIPDYVPPIRPGAMKADPDGHLWILPYTSAQSLHGGLVYDIVNRAGELTERVELPAGRSIAGFGRGGNVYLLSGDRTSGFTIERARFR